MHLAGFNAVTRYAIRQTVPRKRLPHTFRAFSYTTQLSFSERQIQEDDSWRPRTEPNPRAKEIAILGGGITGLTTAYDIARTIPDAKITLYEQSKRLGGWLDSEVVEVDGGEVIFEWGPRSLRPDMAGPGTATVNLIVGLGLLDAMLGILNTSPASYNRYVYYPDHLTRVPGPHPGANFITNVVNGLYSLWKEPIFTGLLGSLVAEPSVKVRQSNIRDESVGAFIERRFGSAVADNLVSAMFHGIYAGDIYQLSMRTLLPSLWYLETRDPDGNGVMTEMMDLFFKRHTLIPYKNIKFRNMSVSARDSRDKEFGATLVAMQLSRCSVYTFNLGMATLSKRLEEVLLRNHNVTIRTGTTVQNVTYHSNQKKLNVSTSMEKTSEQFDYVVSTLRPNLLGACLESSARLRNTDAEVLLLQTCSWADKSVNVMVVNLYYTSPELIPDKYRGFGYLIPRSVALEQNPERALGVIFGSETSGVRGPDAIIDIEAGIQEDSDEWKKMQELVDNAKRRFELAVEESSKNNVENSPGFEEKIADLKRSALSGVAELDELRRSSNNPEKTIKRVGQDTAEGTKLTVMMGGHWWDGWAQNDLPNEEQAIQMAKNVLKRHLGISEEPLVAKARLNRDAIPQYQPFYRDAMAKIHKGLTDEFHGQLKVAGPWWQGAVGVNDCIKKARETAIAIREQWDDKTGLEEYTKDEQWCLFDRRTGSVRIDPMNEKDA